MLAALIGLLGLGGLAWGTTHYVRSRFSARLQPRRERHRRIALATVSVSGFALLAPDAIVGLVIASTGGSGTLATVGWVLYRLLAVGAIGIAALVMWLTSDPVTTRLRRRRDAVVASVPFGPARTTRRMRRHLGAFPQEWNGLLEHDRELTRRLLRYQRDADAAASSPTMADLEHPLTKTAVDAMFRCDDLRTMQPPTHVLDILATDYGRAVAQFDQALRAAEEYASAHVVSTVARDEQRVVADAARTLTFLQTNATTPQERASAYEKIGEKLAKARATAGAEATEPVPTSSHPWLTVEDRARVDND
ncbi:MAG: hypothetical protein ABR500_09225 [Dermatophilaceae bacterium]|nr:hypothetical protein [Intrasporangiaceae bacterium]